MKVTFSCEGYLGRYEEKVRDAFSQGNIHHDSLWEVWENRFQVFRDRRWTRTGSCATCREWKNCRGGDMHNWHDGHLLQCHYAKTLSTP